MPFKNFNKVRHFSIVFSSPPQFGNGDVVSGKVILELNARSKVHAVKLHVKYLNLREELLHADTLSAGVHEYPFSFQIPERMGMFFEAKHGSSIRYWVKVRLHRPWLAVKKAKKEFTVIEPIDINTPY